MVPSMKLIMGSVSGEGDLIDGFLLSSLGWLSCEYHELPRWSFRTGCAGSIDVRMENLCL